MYAVLTVSLDKLFILLTQYIVVFLNGSQTYQSLFLLNMTKCSVMRTLIYESDSDVFGH